MSDLGFVKGAVVRPQKNTRTGEIGILLHCATFLEQTSLLYNNTL